MRGGVGKEIEHCKCQCIHCRGRQCGRQVPPVEKEHVQRMGYPVIDEHEQGHGTKCGHYAQVPVPQGVDGVEIESVEGPGSGVPEERFPCCDHRPNRSGRAQAGPR